MNILQEIVLTNGELAKTPTSRYAVSLWHIPSGCQYDKAKVIVGFWSEDMKEQAESLERKYKQIPEMAVLMDIQDEKFASYFTPKSCKHCGVQVNYHAAGYYVSDATLLPQYCWVDPVDGSQLHEV